MRFDIDPMVKWSSKLTLEFPHAVGISQSHPIALTKSELENIVGPIEQSLPSNLSLDFASRQGGSGFRDALSKQYRSAYACHFQSFCGAQEALFVSLYSLLNKNDRVISFRPTFKAMLQPVLEIGAKLSLLELVKGKSWSIDLNQLEGEIRKGCQLLILNFPHNPTGAHLTLEEFNSIIELCRKYKVYILSDEVFRGLEHDEKRRLPAVADVYEDSVSIGVFSKAYGIPALRIGWAYSHDQELLKRMAEIKAHLSICCSLFDEKIAEQVLPYSNQIFNFHRHILIENRRRLDDFMASQQNIFDYIPAKAGACCFPVLREENIDDFTERLLRQNVKVISGQFFESSYPAFRLSFSDIGYLEKLKEQL